MRSFLLFCWLFFRSAWAFAAQGDLLELTELRRLEAPEIKQGVYAYCTNGPPHPIQIGEAAIRTFAVKYETVDLDGNPTVASGALMFPEIDRPMAIVSYQHGTVFGRDQVPSRLYLEGRVAAYCYGAQGHAVVAADYLGYGDSPGVHPYLNAQSAAIVAADLLRAARAAAGQLALALNGKIFLTGYSQGGAATMALHRHLEKNLAAEFTVTASVPMAGPYDLEYTNLSFLAKTSPHSAAYFAFLVWATNKLHGVFPALEEVIQAPYVGRLDAIFDGSSGYSDVFAALPNSTQALLVPGFAEALLANPEHPFRKILRASNVYDWQPVAPMLILHGSSDIDVPIENMTRACGRMTALGGRVTCRTLAVDHGLGFYEMPQHAISWFESFR